MRKNLRTISLFIILLLILFGLGIWQPQKPAKPPASPGPTPLYKDFHLVVPALKIDAPVIADVDGADKEAYFKALENGVAHFRGTAKPGEKSNIFIFGHSSFYWWSPGNYKEIFKNLPELDEGDEIILWYEGREYKYRITETKTVWPNEVDVLKPTPEEQVSLMTCVPPGTTLKRLIVVAKATQ